MWSYLSRAASPLVTPQSEAIPGTTQAVNSAGGFAWQIASLDRLRRFLILGSEGGSYYASERDLTRQNIDAVRDALDEHGVEAVGEIVVVSEAGRAPKQDPAIYALAVACAHGDPLVRLAATNAIVRVCRTGTHLFMFAEFVEGQRGWGRALKRGVAAWYEREDVKELAYQVVKYRQRGGWTHRDLLRLAHPKTPTKLHAAVFDWICRPQDAPDFATACTDLQPIRAFRAASAAPTAKDTAALIRENGSTLPREALNSDHLASREVWEALLEQGMPMTALIRNLANLTRVGIVAPMSEGTRLVCEQIADVGRLRKARVHPLAALIALLTYAQGHGLRGGNTWEPVPQVIDALDAAFYDCFPNVQPTGKRTLLALDVSGSMSYGMIAGLPLTPRIASAAMALVTASVEPNYHILGFSHELIPLPISKGQRLGDAIKVVSGLPFGGTDCALPMQWAGRVQTNTQVDTFVVYTDSETWSGGIHPAQALGQYRKQTGIMAKLAVVGMVSNGFSIADPNDAGMLDVVGFDTATPQILSEFSAA